MATFQLFKDMIKDHENRLHEIRNRVLPAGCDCFECDTSRKMAVAARKSFEREMMADWAIGSHFRWRSIEDSVPPEGVDVLLLDYDTCDKHNCSVVQRDGNIYTRVDTTETGKPARMLFWMPIPPLDALEMKS